MFEVDELNMRHSSTFKALNCNVNLNPDPDVKTWLFLPNSVGQHLVRYKPETGFGCI